MMYRRKIGVIDMGSGNLFGVRRALQYAECDAETIETPENLFDMDAVLLPGVGAFESGMNHLREVGLDMALREFSASGKPMLGICLGMQFLVSHSSEFGHHTGLDLIPGSVTEIQPVAGWPVPNIGWCEISLQQEVKDTPFSSASTGTDFYFAHSFHCVPDHPEDCLATIDYGDQKIVAIISHSNVHGCQFHPELSEQAGLDVFKWLATST
jgi:imidazole glycerol-phosphate synthase subunit HisH